MMPKQLRWFFPLFFWGLVSCSKSDKALRIKGSDTEVNLAVELAEAFYATNSEVSLAISGGGSGLGIASLYNGQADIANSSRPLTDDEKRLFADKNIVLLTNIFAEDATAIVVNSTVSIDEIDVKTLGKVFDGSISNWNEITGENRPITIYGRQNNSGTHSFVQQKLGIQFSTRAREMNGNAQIMEGIKVDPSGIGYVGAGYLLNSNHREVKALKIKKNTDDVAISPLDKEAIKHNRYYFQRPLYQFIPKSSWQKAKSFIDFERSDKGKEIIIKSGYYVMDH